MKWTIDKALAFIQSHRSGNGYIVKTEQEEKKLRSALQFVFEENANSYYLSIKRGG